MLPNYTPVPLGCDNGAQAKPNICRERLDWLYGRQGRVNYARDVKKRRIQNGWHM